MNTQSIYYDRSKQLLKVKEISTIGKTDLISIIGLLPAYFKNHQRLKVLLNFSNAEIKITRNELYYIADCLHEKVLAENSIRIANIVSKPIDTALAVLFKTIVQNRSQLEFEIFSTKSAALHWLIISN